MLISSDFTTRAEMNGARQTQSKQIRRKKKREEMVYSIMKQNGRRREKINTRENSFPLFDLKINAFWKSQLFNPIWQQFKGRPSYSQQCNT